ncbi:MAG: ABC transporter permease, partial [Thermoanaerobaculia bacterium]
MENFLSNLRFAARSLRKNPGLTAVALLTLALGIGANTAVFSVVNTVVLRPLPYPEPHRLVRVWPEQSFTKELLDAFVERTHGFSALSGYAGSSFSVSGTGRPEVIPGAVVSASHFAVMGVDPVLGRAFLAEEGVAGTDGVAIIGHGLWQRRFAGAEGVLGRTLKVNGAERTIVGVMPAGYEPLHLAWEVWTPLAIEPGTEAYRDFANLRVVARLAPGLGTAEARSDVRALAMELHREDPSRYGEDGSRAAGVVALHEAVVRGIRPTLLALFGAVALVLLIACANVSNLLLARAGARQREIAVRTALGADRRRLVGQLLTESALLAVLGGALGLLAAAWTVALIGDRLPARVPRVEELAVDGRVMGFALAASLLSVLIFGLAPALRGTRLEVFVSLRAGGRGAGDPLPRQHLSRALVAIEIALAVVVVAGAGLLGKSFWRLQQTELGFRPESTLSLQLSPTFGDSARLRAFYGEVVERVEALPAVISAGVANQVPMSSGSMGVDYSTVDHPTPPGQPAPFVGVKLVSEETLKTLGVPLLQGRSLLPSDRPDAPRVGLINRVLAGKLWGEEDSVGRELSYGDGSEWFTIVGVVGDVRQHRLDLE